MAVVGDTMVDPAQLAAFLSANAGSTSMAAAAINGFVLVSRRTRLTTTAKYPAARKASIQQQLSMLQQQMQQQQIQQQQSSHQDEHPQQQHGMVNLSAQRIKMNKPGSQPKGIPRTIMAHTHLERGDPEDLASARLFRKLSIDELFRFSTDPDRRRVSVCA